MSAVPQSMSATSLDRRIQMLRTAMGPLIAAALEDPDVVEIMLNPDRTLWVDRLSSGRAPMGVEMPEADGERIIRLVAAHVGAEVHRGQPLLSAELPETGERFEGILPPAAPGPAFALRKRAIGVIPLERYVIDGMMTSAQAGFLVRAVRERQNVLIAGATSSGKTTLANALLAEIAATGDRVLVLEDTVELQCAARDHVPLRTRAGVVSMTELVRSSMRLRPDRVVVGEVRGAEALDLIKVWGTGHPGGIATIHAGSALGALLRGPLVGLTEEELLDIIWGLPRSEEQPDRIPRLDLSIDPAVIAHPLAREVIERLQSLSRRGNSTTPHELLSQAVDVMRVRPLLLERHRGQAERALANVDLYLSLSTSYAVRGLRAFAEAMTTAWSDEARAVEGRPDAQEEAVALFTMHAAKGLEWPIVIPVNTMTGVMAPDSAVIDRQTETFYCPVLGATPEGYETARQAEKEELDRERIRLWYVAATRARELLVLPRLDATPSKSAWIGLVDLSLADLPGLDVSHLPAGLAATGAGAGNTQTRASFAAEAEAIVAAHTRLTWLAPSRDENAAGTMLREEEAALWTGSADDPPPELEAAVLVQGGRERGLILHKLMEEVLTGEIPEAEAALTERAGHLIRALGQSPVADPATGLSAQELAACVARTLALPDIAALRPGLLAEFPVYSAQAADGVETATVGIADALTLTAEGRPAVVVDWKSDVTPMPGTLDHYRAQVRAYLDMTGAERGLIVLMTSGAVVPVLRV